MKLIAFIFLCMGLLGCTKEPPLKTYSLDVPTVKVVKYSHYKNKSIKVTYPQSLKEQITQKMNFSYSSSDRGEYQKSEWSNHISKLLQGTFIEILDKSRLFKAVLLDTSTAKENYRLESNIFIFEHKALETNSQAIISIQFILIDTDIGNLIKSKRFSYAEVTKTVDAKGYAEATNLIIARLSNDLLSWLQR